MDIFLFLQNMILFGIVLMIIALILFLACLLIVGGTVMFDEQGYPTEETLEKISKFNHFETPISEIIAYLREHWRYEDMGYFEWDECHARNPLVKTMYLHLHTGGWSGNESIITSLKQSAFWLCYWMRTERGGHYTLEVTFDKDVKR